MDLAAITIMGVEGAAMITVFLSDRFHAGADITRIPDRLRQRAVTGGLGVPVPDGRAVTVRDGHLALDRLQAVRGVDGIAIWISVPPALPDGARTEGDRPAPHTIVMVEGGMDGPEGGSAREGAHAIRNTGPRGLKGRDAPGGRR